MDRIAPLFTGALIALPALLSVLPIYALGMAAAWLLGLRGFLVPITAVPLLIGGTAALAELFHGLRLASSPFILMGALLFLCVLYFLVGHLSARRRTSVAQSIDQEQHDRRWVPLGGAIGGVLGLGTWLSGIATKLPPQGNDDIFHGYLVARLLHATDLNAASVAPDFVGQSSPISYYPYGIHLFSSMAVSGTSQNIPAAMNGTWVLLMGAVLPLATAVAAGELFTARPRVALWAGILAPTATGLYLLNGIMSYVLALSLIPAVIALYMRRISKPQGVPWVVLTIVTMSLFVAHPAVAASAAVIVACITVGALLSRRQSARLVLTSLIAPALGAAVLTFPSYLAAGSSGVTGQSPVNRQMDALSAVSMAVKLGTPWTPAQPVLGTLVVLGAVAAFRWRMGLGLLASYTLFAIAYVAVLSGYTPVASRTGLWYGQWYRLAGIGAVLAALLAGLGVEIVVRSLARFSKRDRRLLIRATATVCLVGTLAVTSVASAQYLFRGQSIVRTAWSHTTVTDDDRALFARARETIGKEQVLNYWADGSTWMYAIAGLTPAIPYDTTVRHANWASQMLNSPMSIQSTPGLCEEMFQRHIRFAIAKTTLNNGEPSQFYRDLATNRELFQQIDRSGTATLYAVRPETLERCR